MSSHHPAPRRALSALTGLGLAAVLAVAGASATTPARADSPASATGARATGPTAPTARESRIVRRAVTFDVVNTNESSVACTSDRGSYTLRGTLVGSRRAVSGADGGGRINVLVHDVGTGGWFWQAPQRAYDYAGALARRGELTLVLDRLGYDGSPLDDGRATCLGAQADMLHQVIQRLYAGNYAFADGRGIAPPHALHVVVHGHAVGAAIAQLEAADHDDVDGLVLMSWSDTNASQRAVQEAGRQTLTCLGGASYASYGETANDFASLLFADAVPSVLRRATALRNAVPCGDVTSLSGLLLASLATTGRIEVPVLLLFGSEDALNRPGSADRQAARFGASPSVTTRTFAGVGSALPLERKAPQVQRTVLRWLDRH